MTNFLNYKDKGLTGLANVGNTCYLNSCMQIISHTYELNDFLNNKNYRNKLNKSADTLLLVEWDNLRELMWSGNYTISPNGFVSALKHVSLLKNKEMFSNYSQNDIQEYILFILDCFHNALSREVEMQITGNNLNNTDNYALKCYNMMKNLYKNEYSEIIDIFFSIQITELKSIKTNELLNVIPESFSILSLPIPNDIKEPSLKDCFNLYCKTEQLIGEESITNERTNMKEDVNKKIFFWDLPKILIIDLKRWNENGKKNNKLVKANINNVNLTNYVVGYNKLNNIYDLYGVCNHFGGSLGGHYTSYIKNANNKWYEFNDTIINEIDESKIITQNSYCFFYRKKK
tara:strand:- start:137 stop:1171 length:1035 start_codon:yes stop_codon:yes gene_type:complete